MGSDFPALSLALGSFGFSWLSLLVFFKQHKIPFLEFLCFGVALTQRPSFKSDLISFPLPYRPQLDFFLHSWVLKQFYRGGKELLNRAVLFTLCKVGNLPSEQSHASHAALQALKGVDGSDKRRWSFQQRAVTCPNELITH